MENNYEVQRSLGRIEGNIGQIMTDIKLMRDDHAGLRSEFQKLEAGRLTRPETQFATTQAIMHTKAKNIALIYSAFTAIIVSIATALILNFLKL